MLSASFEAEENSLKPPIRQRYFSTDDQRTTDASKAGAQTFFAKNREGAKELMRRCAQCHGRLGLGSASAICGVGTGGFICAFVRLAAKAFSSKTARRPTLSVVGTPSSLQAVRGADSLSCSTHCDRADQRTENHPTPRRLRLGCATRRWPVSRTAYLLSARYDPL